MTDLSFFYISSITNSERGNTLQCFMEENSMSISLRFKLFSQLNVDIQLMQLCLKLCVAKSLYKKKAFLTEEN